MTASASLNILDVVFLIVVFFSILLGVIKGFVRELFSLVFLVVATAFAFLFYYEAGTFFMKYLENRQISNVAGFITIFVIILIVGAVVTYFLKKILTVGPLKSVDRILGGVFGLIRGILISGIIVFGLAVLPVKDDLMMKSRLSPYVIHSIDIFIKLLPENLRKKIDFIKGGTKKGGGSHDGQKNS